MNGLSTVMDDNNNNTPEPSFQSRRTFWCLFIIQLSVVLIFAGTLVYMIASVNLAYEYEVVDEPHLRGQKLYALEHFPGFRISFIGIVVAFINIQIFVNTRPSPGSFFKVTLFAILLMVTFFLYCAIEFVQHNNDRFSLALNGESPYAGYLAVGLLFYWGTVMVFTSYSMFRLFVSFCNYDIPEEEEEYDDDDYEDGELVINNNNHCDVRI